VLLSASGLLVFWVGALHEFIGWFQGRVPLEHLSSANLAINAAAISDGQLGIPHDILCSAVSTDKIAGIGGCGGAHSGIIYARVLLRYSRFSRMTSVVG